MKVAAFALDAICPRKIALSSGRAKNVGPSVKVEDCGPLDRIRRSAPPSRHAADSCRLVTYVHCFRSGRDELVIHGACFRPEFQCRLEPKLGSHCLHGGVIRRIFAVIYRIHSHVIVLLHARVLYRCEPTQDKAVFLPKVCERATLLSEALCDTSARSL